MSSKTLVAYFSATGTTARAARRLAESVGADLYEIRPAVPYTRADLNWADSKSRSTLEAHDAACRPAIAGEPVDLSGYATVFVGFPIWWYTAPRIIHSFLESHDFAGKRVVPFATSGGSGLGDTEQILRKRCSPETRWLPGRRLSSGARPEAVQRWLNECKQIKP